MATGTEAGRGMTWFAVAAGLGTFHAAASLYWATGGEWLADTVGQWAIEWRRSAPVGAGLSLLAIGLVKLAGAWAPWLSERVALPAALRSWVRAISWVGGVLLVLYGAANAVVANVALTGALGPVTDVAAMRGHAWLWDPLFAMWGAALVAALWCSRARSG